MQDKDDSHLLHRTARGTLYLLIQNLVIATSGSLFFMVIARFLPNTSDLGLINGLLLVINLVTILTGLGLTNAATRFMSYHLGSQREDLAIGVGALIFRIGLASSFIISFVLYYASHYIASTLFHDIRYTNLIQLGSVDIFLVSIVSFSFSILYSLHEFRKIAIVSIIGSILKSATGSLLLLVFGMGVDGIVIGFIIGDAASLLISVYGLRPIIFASRLSREIRSLFRYSLPLYASYILNFLSVNIDYYLILSLSGLSTAGIYSPAVFFATLLVTALAALEQALLPFFSRIYGKSGLGTLENLSHVISRYIFLIYFPMGFAILASAPLIISEILGERYIGSILPAMTLILAITLTSIGTVFNNILKSAGHSNIFLTSTIGALSVQLLVSLITLPSLGALGAALARSCAYTTLFITPAYKLKRVSRLHYDRIALRKGLIGSIVMASVIFILNSYSPNPWYLLLNLFGGLISYLVFLRFVRAMDIKDFETLDNILLGKLKWPIRLTMKIVLR